MPMRPWRELLDVVEKGSPAELRFESVAELGFGCGAILRSFSSWYWKATKVGGEGKDYLKHRVLTFGADLTPDLVWRVGLGKLCDVAVRYENEQRRLPQRLRQRVGVVLTELDRWQNELRSSRDEFMTGFWAGYCLQGYDRLAKAKTPVVDKKEVV